MYWKSKIDTRKERRKVCNLTINIGLPLMFGRIFGSWALIYTDSQKKGAMGRY